MDGLKRKITQSLQFKLSICLAFSILIVALLAAAFSYKKSFNYARELQDDQLRQVAALIGRHHVTISPTDSQDQVPDTDPETRVIIQIQNPQQNLPTENAADFIAFPANLPDGMQDILLKKISWRVFVHPLEDGRRIIVGQQAEVRNEIARHTVKNTLLPFAILIPLLVALIVLLIGGMFKPLRQLTAELHNRAEDNLNEISTCKLPSEISPLVKAMNQQFSKLSQLLAMQRRFIADAAHELRSPMTALSLQAEQLAAVEMPVIAQERLASLRSGLQRSRSLLEQLLSFSRSQAMIAEPHTQAISIAAVLRRVLEDLMPLAEDRQIDLGITSEADALLAVTELDLRTLIKNLLENAIRYTPPKGRVDCSIHADKQAITIQIEDNGPGIAVDERERVFDPFYRVLGNEETGAGLGLAIVKSIADKIHAEIKLADAQMPGQSGGLRVQLIFPTSNNAKK